VFVNIHRKLQKLIRYLPLIIVFTWVLMPSSAASNTNAIEVVVEEPQLHPAYTTCPDSYWYPFANNRGHTAYLTLNADIYNSTNHGEWHPVIPQSGYYRVDAYIAAHNAIVWCTGADPRTINHDTTEARYSIHHAYGVASRYLSQYPLSNQWLNLGEYYFTAGQTGYVSLTDLNGETKFTTTVSFSAMRFTFTRLTRPNIFLPVVNNSDPSGQPAPDTGVIQAQGFDACHLPTISEMQTWWKNSPYRFYALYLGGISLFHECTVPSATWVSAVHQQGWSFLPTWVGPQAPCSPYKNKMSSDPAVAYQQGRQEAQAASSVASSIGLSSQTTGGTIIYYDMEVYGGASLSCRQAAASFINGWVERLHELGNSAGGYGSQNSYVPDWAKITNVPDDVWAAAWYTNYYDPNASVSGLTWLQGLWINHQRIRQYTGGHNETWGGVKFNIDSDVADGLVAMPPRSPLSSPVISASASFEDTGWLTPDQGWLVSGNRLYWTDDQGQQWQDISPAQVSLAHFLPDGNAWALGTQSEAELRLSRSSDGGITWTAQTIALPPDAWHPLQLQFTSPASGWIVLHKGTSQAFNIGMLLKTTDGGLTWERHDLPKAAPIYFSTDTDGWLGDESAGPVYITEDGGQTWQLAAPEKSPQPALNLPEGSSLAVWQSGKFG
jgi:photosystem II stability/assembly factor-like uncharacterized protein